VPSVAQVRPCAPSMGRNATGAGWPMRSPTMIVTPLPVRTVSPGLDPVTLPPSGLAPMSTMTDQGGHRL